MYFLKHLDEETATVVAAISYKVFGDSAETYMPFLYDVFAGSVTNVSYDFMTLDEYMRLPDIQQVQRVYWTEIVFRCHLAATTSILRHMKWIDGVLLSAYLGNWYSFAANFRGLIESFADAVDCLSEIPDTLASDFSYIANAIEGKAHVMRLNEKLENKLIHYSHAKQTPKSESPPPEQIAQATRHYLIRLQGDTEELKGLLDCYSWLCQTTHPAAHTVHFFFDPSKDGSTIRLKDDRDYLWIDDFCKRNQRMMYYLFQKSFNLAFLSLKVINRLPLPRLRLEKIELLDFGGVGRWKAIEGLLRR